MPAPERQHHKRSPSTASPGTDKTTAIITLGVFGAALVGIVGVAYGAKFIKPPAYRPPSPASEMEYARKALWEGEMLYRQHDYVGAGQQAAEVRRQLERLGNVPGAGKMAQAARRLEAEARHMSRR